MTERMNPVEQLVIHAGSLTRIPRRQKWEFIWDTKAREYTQPVKRGSYADLNSNLRLPDPYFIFTYGPSAQVTSEFWAWYSMTPQEKREFITTASAKYPVFNTPEMVERIYALWLHREDQLMEREAHRRGYPITNIGDNRHGQEYSTLWQRWFATAMLVRERLLAEFGVEEFARADGSPLNFNDVPRFRAVAPTTQYHYWLGDFEQVMADAMALFEETIRAQHGK